MMLRRYLPGLLAAAALTGCSPEPDADAKVDAAASPEASLAAPATSPAPAAAPTALPSPIAEFGFPAAMLGRWGLVPGDCDPSQGDDKGSLLVAPTTLTFYESRARITTITASEPARLRASLAYEGEGQSWKTEADLRLGEGGKTLILAQTGPDAPREVLTYNRCPDEKAG